MTKPRTIAVAILVVIASSFGPSQARPATPDVVARLPNWTQIKNYVERGILDLDGRVALVRKPHVPVRATRPPTVVTARAPALQRERILDRVSAPAGAGRSVRFIKMEPGRGMLYLHDGAMTSHVEVVFDGLPTVMDQRRLADTANVAIDVDSWSQPSRFTVHVKAQTIDVHKLDGTVETFDEPRIKLVLPNPAVIYTPRTQVARD